MIRLLFILGVFLVLSIPPAYGASPVTAKPKLIVGGDHDCPPYEFLENGVPTGFDVELMRAAAGVMGFDVEFRLGRWSKVRQDLEQGRIDALAGMYYSSDRSRFVDFSVPHTMVTSGIFVRKDSPIRSYAHMQGKEIIVQEGDIIHDSLKHNGLASRIVAVADAGQALKLLASGKHDCAVMASRLQGEYYVNAFGLANIRCVDTELPQQWYCFAVRKGNQVLVSRLDEGLKILKVSGKYRQIHEKWFGVYEKSDMWQAGKHYVLALVLVALLCVGILVWSRMLKRRVEQRTAELRNSEGRLRTLLQTLPDLVWLKDSNGVYLACNAMFERFFGAAAAVIVGKTDYDFVDRELADFFTMNDRKAMAAGKPTSNEEWITFADDGHRALLETIKTPVYDDVGRLIGVLGIGRDITQRKQSEEALRESEEKFRVLAETLPAGVCLYQGERHVYINAAFTRLTGYTERECLSMRFWDWIHPDYEEQVRERGLARQRGEEVSSQYEFKCVTKRGEEKWLFLSAGRIEYKGKPAGIVSFIDITDRKRMEEELRHAQEDLEKRVEERTAELAETVNKLLLSQFCIDKTAIGIYQTTFEGDILSANEFACRSLGYTADELRALKVSDIDPVITHEKMLEIKGMLDKSGFATHETVHRRKDGSSFPVEIMTNQLEFQGRPYTFSFVTDITERKRAEEELERQKRRLQELNCALEKMVEEEVAKNREKDVILIQQNRQAALGEMLDHIAHQWKQPLNVISFMVQDAEATWACGEMTDHYVRENVDKTMDLVQHMAQTIEVFRDFYRSEKEKTAFSIKEAIDRALSFISPALRFHAVALGVDVDPGLTAVGYPKEYAQVLLNIVTNARDAFVERKTEKPRLEVKAFEEGGKAVVTITDNGGGIPDPIIDKVFDLYFTTRESSGGTGVGLYMSKNIIEKNMGGKLSASNVGGGAQFRIELEMPKPGFDN